MDTRFIRLGVDYGTSTSKLVFRDPLAPGGEKAYVILRDGSFRIRSSVAFTGTELLFGRAPEQQIDLGNATWFQSVKMRVAGEVTGNYARFCHGPRPRLPDRVSAEDLAVVSVWFLISEAEKAICRHFGLSKESLKLSVTLGLPMNFFEDRLLRKAFLRIAWSARRIHQDCGSLENARISLTAAQELIGRYSKSPEETAVPEEDLRNWLRPESEAGMCLAVKSPSALDGPYAEVDIGAGTTHASFFSILPGFHDRKWVKERLMFFGTKSESVGMDAVDAALAESRRLPHNQCLLLRGQELKEVGRVGKVPIRPILERMRDAYIMAWRRASPKLHLPEHECFQHHEVFVTGGGSLIPEVAQVFATHPDGYAHRLRLRHLSVPSDLFRTDRKSIGLDDMRFLAAAYGLTFHATEVPETFTPDDVPSAVRPRRPRIDWEEI